MTTDQSKPDGGWTPPPGHATDEQENAVAAPASPTSNGAELAPRVPAQRTVNPALGVAVTSFDDAMAMARALAPSGALPKALQGKPADILTVMMYAAELGMTPVQGFRAIDVVEGRPQLSGQFWIVRIRQAGHKFKIVEHTSDKCTVSITRHDEPDDPYLETFTLQDAADQRLVQIKDGKAWARSKNGNALPWETATKRMLLWRATTNCASIACPEVAYGFEVADRSHEMVDDAGQRVKPSLAEVAANRDQGIRPAASSGPDTEPLDITDAEVVEDEPSPAAPTADDLAEMAGMHQPQPVDVTDLPVEDPPDDNGLFGDDDATWPEVKRPGGGR